MSNVDIHYRVITPTTAGQLPVRELTIKGDEFSTSTLVNAQEALVGQVEAILDHLLTHSSNTLCPIRFSFGSNVVVSEPIFWRLVLTNLDDGRHRVLEYLKCINSAKERRNLTRAGVFSTELRQFGSFAVEAQLDTARETICLSHGYAAMAADSLMEYLRSCDMGSETHFEEYYIDLVLNALIGAKDLSRYIDLLYFRLFNDGQRVISERNQSYLFERTRGDRFRLLIDEMIKRQNGGAHLHRDEDYLYLIWAVYGDEVDCISELDSYIRDNCKADVDLVIPPFMKMFKGQLQQEAKLLKEQRPSELTDTGFHTLNQATKKWERTF